MNPPLVKLITKACYVKMQNFALVVEKGWPWPAEMMAQRISKDWNTERSQDPEHAVRKAGMSYWPALAFHVCAGALGLLSGAVAMSLRKGSRCHRMARSVFVITVLSMAGSAVYLGPLKQQTVNCLIAFLTAYLVATAWMTARRRDGETGIFDFGALLAALALGAGFTI